MISGVGVFCSYFCLSRFAGWYHHSPAIALLHCSAAKKVWPKPFTAHALSGSSEALNETFSSFYSPWWVFISTACPVWALSLLIPTPASYFIFYAYFFPFSLLLVSGLNHWTCKAYFIFFASVTPAKSEVIFCIMLLDHWCFSCMCKNNTKWS